MILVFLVLLFFKICVKRTMHVWPRIIDLEYFCIRNLLKSGHANAVSYIYRAVPNFDLCSRRPKCLQNQSVVYLTTNSMHAVQTRNKNDLIDRCRKCTWCLYTVCRIYTDYYNIFFYIRIKHFILAPFQIHKE